MSKLKWDRTRASHSMERYGAERFFVEGSDKEPATKEQIKKAIESGEMFIRLSREQKRRLKKMVFCQACGLRLHEDDLAEHGRRQHGKARPQEVVARIDPAPGKGGSSFRRCSRCEKLVTDWRKHLAAHRA